MRKSLLVILCALSCAISCQDVKPVQVELLISNAQIVDVLNGKILPSQFIAINGDSIVETGSMSEMDAFEAQQISDAKNQYIMPGLWDNHVHFRGGDSLINENKNLLPFYLKYGITTVRDAGGDITPAILNWRKEISNQRLLGPQILTSGPKLDGTKPAWAGSIKVVTDSEVSKALDSLQEIGVDYVKMYDGNLTKDSYYSIIKQAEERGLKTTGHMPLSANILTAVEYGLDGSEHLYYVLKACSSKADSLNKIDVNYSFMSEIANSFDSAKAIQVYKILAENNVFITPTLYIGGVLGNLLEHDHELDSLLPLMGPGIKETYQMRIDRAKRAAASGNNNRLELAKVFKSMIKPMYEEGVQILAGSDGGAYNSYVYPGESLHGELRALVLAGLTPQEALTTSVIYGPAFFEMQHKYGGVSKGKNADLLILRKNPLNNIDNLLTIEAIFVGGKSINIPELDQLIYQ